MTHLEQITRRGFLGLCGLTFGAASVGLPLNFAPEPPVLFGRGLVQSSILNGGKPLGTLWPNTRVHLLSERGGYFHLQTGWVAREAVQPMPDFEPRPTPPSTFPVDAEVVGIAAVIRQHPTVNSLIVAHFGHGATARLLDRIPDGRSGLDWLQVELAPGQVGWSQIGPWRAAELEITPLIDTIVLDRSTYTLDALHSDEVIFSAPFAAAAPLVSGQYALENTAHTAQVDGNYGLAYPLQFEILKLVGDYQHHRFGGLNPGAAVQVAPMTARALASLHRTNTRLIVV